MCADAPERLVSVEGAEQRGLESLSALRTGSWRPLFPPCFAAVPYVLDFRDVAGNEMAKRALQIAAAGSHGILMTGPPGSGKTMLASRLPSILPPLEEGEALEVALVHSVAGCDIAPATYLICCEAVYKSFTFLYQSESTFIHNIKIIGCKVQLIPFKSEPMNIFLY